MISLFATFNVKAPKLEEYFQFCLSHKQTKEVGKTADHHLLPRVLFPEYETDVANIVTLSHQNHYKAHFLLAQAVDHPSILFAWNSMKNKNRTLHGILVDDESQEYQMLMERVHITLSKQQRGMVMCKDKNGNVLRVTKEDFDNRDDLFGIMKGISPSNKGKTKDNCKSLKIVSEKLTGRTISQLTKDNLSAASKGFVACKNKMTGEIFKVTSEEFYSNSNLVGHSYGTHTTLGYKHSDKTKELLRAKRQGLTSMTDHTRTFFVHGDEVSTFLIAGASFGRHYNTAKAQS